MQCEDELFEGEPTARMGSPIGTSSVDKNTKGNVEVKSNEVHDAFQEETEVEQGNSQNSLLGLIFKGMSLMMHLVSKLLFNKCECLSILCWNNIFKVWIW